jgi:hypothetical protein
MRKLTKREDNTMKNFIIIIIMLFMIPIVHAQDIDLSSTSAKVRIGDLDISLRKAPFMQGDWELTTAGAFGSMSRKTSSSAGSYKYSNESSSNYAFLSLMADYYIIDRLSIEPEISLLAVKDAKPGETILLNVSYTQPLGNSIVALFIRGGYGLGNASSIPIMPELPIQMTDGFKVNTINAGGGVKLLIAQGVALRIEVNYKYQTCTYDFGGGYPAKYDYTYSIIRCYFGLSALL